MTKALIVCGGRNYIWKQKHVDLVRDIIKEGGYTEVIHGGATGADQIGNEAVIGLKMQLTIMPPLWEQHGRAAGPIRNEQMAYRAHERDGGIVAFKGGRGTENMLHWAKRYNLKVEYNEN